MMGKDSGRHLARLDRADPWGLGFRGLGFRALGLGFRGLGLCKTSRRLPSPTSNSLKTGPM